MTFKPSRLLIGAATCICVALSGSGRAEDAKRVPQKVPGEEATASRHGTVPGLQHGLCQSPVNILTRQAEGGRHEIALNFHHAEPNYLQNKGHTIELDFPEGSSIRFDGNDYQLEQLHFHTPSEHQIDGVVYPMEMHVVNIAEPENPDDLPRYLVVSFLYRMGEEDPVIASFLDQVPSEEGGAKPEAGRVHVAPADGTPDLDYYHYQGSLTTPPYTETVEWLVVQEIHEASPDQIRRIHAIEGDNARRVQPLYGRKVDD